MRIIIIVTKYYKYNKYLNEIVKNRIICKLDKKKPGQNTKMYNVGLTILRGKKK